MGLKELPKHENRDVGVVPRYDQEEKIREFDESQKSILNKVKEDNQVAERARQDRIKGQQAEK